jgi:hypothetical protein
MSQSSHSFQDDLTISDSELLWRRVHKSQFVFDPSLGRKRISTAAFRNHPNDNAMSVVLASVSIQFNRPASQIASETPNVFIASIEAAVVRAQNQVIVRDPTPMEPGHANVHGPKPKSVQRAFAEAATIVTPPPV